MEPLTVRALQIGLTGGIGSGKSTVAAMLVELGATLVDTDAIARSLTASGGAAMPALLAEFGASVAASNGALDRDAMRRLAFSDPSARRRLEAVLHPLIGLEADRQAAAAPDTPIVFDVPLLATSSRWRSRVDRVLVIDCDEATQIERVTQRPGWSAESARAAIGAQSPRAQRRAMADAVIVNQNLSLEALRHEVGALWRVWNNGRDTR